MITVRSVYQNLRIENIPPPFETGQSSRTAKKPPILDQNLPERSIHKKRREIYDKPEWDTCGSHPKRWARCCLQVDGTVTAFPMSPSLLQSDLQDEENELVVIELSAHDGTSWLDNEGVTNVHVTLRGNDYMLVPRADLRRYVYSKVELSPLSKTLTRSLYRVYSPRDAGAMLVSLIPTSDLLSKFKEYVTSCSPPD